jgi:hypothetical protein
MTTIENSPTAVSTLTVTLTKVSYNASLSDETNAFTAIVCVNGVPSFEAANHGTGGGNEYAPLTYQGDGASRARAAQERVSAYARSLPRKSSPIPGHEDFSYAQSLDTLVDDAFEAWRLDKDVAKYRKQLCDRVLALNPKGQLVKMSKPGPGRLDAQIAWMKAKHPEMMILNCLPIPDAVKGIRNALANH